MESGEQRLSREDDFGPRLFERFNHLFDALVRASHTRKAVILLT